MLAFLSVLSGAVVGCGVCAFGMWAFLKGQREAIVVKSGGVPDTCLIGRPKATSNSSLSIAEQLNSMFKTTEECVNIGR